MRISTLQLYQRGMTFLQDQQARLQQTEQQLASGLRFSKPSEDPAAAVKVLDLKARLGGIDQYQRNSTLAETSLAFEESVMGNVLNTLQRVRELVIQGSNDTNAGAARQNIAQEIYQRLDELIALANTRDAQGEFIFGGFRVESPPFVATGGSVQYQGDQGQRLLQVGDGKQIAIRDHGQEVFQLIPGGDGVIQVGAGAANNGTAVIGSFGLTGSFNADSYTVAFSQLLPGDPVTYNVTDSASNLVASGTYEEGESIAFAGIQFAVSGMPADGDEIVVTPAQNQDIFSTVKAIADALAQPTPDAASAAGFHNILNSNLANLDQGMEKINSIRAGIGARLNNLETLNEVNEDFRLQLQTTLSDTQDLDFTEAISRFNLQLTSLQAAQQAYIRTTGLTLFQYL
ncbi:MAG: flagellar hook-associated protein FlgL [Gammaproteobacteria bacterium]|nr:flagellar hook-associated protein FlgL [Pseudomonadales bacterium]MCP5349019.1 flagellar hook-associated protein FlgL [Pseudomonadales bacterium]